MKNFILFDFDGVIVDSFCIAFETRKLLCPDITENQCRRCFEGNVNDWESSFNIHTDACQHNAVEFDPLYKKRLKTEARIVPGIEAEIAKLEKEYRLLVVSSSIGVTWGFHTPETLQQGNPFRLVEHPEKLSPAVSDYFQEKLI